MVQMKIATFIYYQLVYNLCYKETKGGLNKYDNKIWQ